MISKIKNVGTLQQIVKRYVINGNTSIPAITLSRFNCNFSKRYRLFGTKMTEIAEVFNGSIDRYNGITIDTEQQSINIEEFSNQLERSLLHWNNISLRTIWFKVNTKDSRVVPVLTENGFNFHHARQGFVMMAKWLPTDSLPNIPEYSHTMIGVGGLVVNNKNQILTISEKHAIIPGSWKLPGGYVEPNEHYVDAVIREVVEETGIRTKFDSVVCIRHATGGANNINFGFGCSDLYIVIALTPENEEIVSCDREILYCEWLDFDKYLEHPKVHQMNRLFLKTYIDNRKKGIRITCTDHIHELLKRKYQIYGTDTINQKDKSEN